MKYVLASLLAVGLIGGTASAADDESILTGDRLTQHQDNCASGTAKHCLDPAKKATIQKKVSSAMQDDSDPKEP